MSGDSPRSFWKTLAIMIASVGILILVFVILPAIPDLLGLGSYWGILVAIAILSPIEIKIIHWIYRQPSGKRSPDPSGEHTP